MTKTALIFGINGQTGSYLAEYLLSLNYTVHGVIRRSSNFNTERLDSCWKQIADNLHYGDLLDALFIVSILQKTRPDEIYNLAAQSHVLVSFQNPSYTANVDGMGLVNILEAVRNLHFHCRIYQASTSEMYGGHCKDYTKEQWSSIIRNGMDEQTPFHPKSPYGAAKLFAHNMVQIYRSSYNMFICSGICFNHESPRRDPRFLPRKVTRAVAHIHHGLQTELVLGNLEAERDWGFAGDYVVAMHAMLQQPEPADYVVATGVNHSVRYLVEIAFKEIGIDLVWEGSGLQEIGKNAKDGAILVRISDKYYRPLEVHYLKGNAKRARKILRWQPRTRFEDMIRQMVRHDLRLIPNKS